MDLGTILFFSNLVTNWWYESWKLCKLGLKFCLKIMPARSKKHYAMECEYNYSNLYVEFYTCSHVNVIM